MPLSPPVARQPIHTRTIVCNGYRRDDGLWDVDAHLTDVKTYAFFTDERGDMPAGKPIHGMWIRLTVDTGFTVHAIEAVTDDSPYIACPGITANFQQLVGLTIGPGWTKAVKERLSGVNGCTHLVELMGPVATVAFQTIYPMITKEQRERERATGIKTPQTGRPTLLNMCHIFASDGPVVQRYWPDYYTGPEEAAAE